VTLNRSRAKAETLRERVEGEEDSKEERDRNKAERRKAKIKTTACDLQDQRWRVHRRTRIGMGKRRLPGPVEKPPATYAYPIIGTVPVADVDEAMVPQVLEPHWRRATAAMKKLRARIAKVLGYAAAKGYRPRGQNPAAGLRSRVLVCQP
jgi:hypothetical protein